MEFPNVEEGTQERFARLWPLVADNQKLKEAAKEAPDMLKFSREGGSAHFKLYESRIPAGVDADKSFGAFATEEAKAASIEESANYKAAKKVVDAERQKTIDERYPENIRYYPAVEAGEGKDRDAFNKVVADVMKEKGLERKDVVQYSNLEGVKAFVSKVGPIPQLEYWQSDEAKDAWKKEGEKLSAQQDKTVSRAKDVVDRSSLQAEGKDFLAKYSKGLAIPPKKMANERESVEAEIRGASTKDLQEVRAASEREFKALEKKLYAIQIQAAQKADPEMTAKKFNDLKPQERREAAGYNELDESEFRRMVRTKDGFFAVSNELKDRGEHLSVEQARDLKNKKEPSQTVKPVDEKGQSQKAETPAKDGGAEPAAVGRPNSKGAAAAAALANTMGRGR